VSADLIHAFARALGPAAPPDAARPAAEELLARWREPHRHYHTTSHLVAALDAVAALLDAGATVPDRGAVELAVWFHDAVHTGRAGADEEASARLAEERLPLLGQAPGRVREVARLVRLTARHDPGDDDAAGQLLSDADLAVLGSPPEDYRAYARAVRREYAHVPDGAFRAGRAAVLRELDTGPLYRTGAGRSLWLDRARANLAAELRDLTSPAG